MSTTVKRSRSLTFDFDLAKYRTFSFSSTTKKAKLFTRKYKV